MKAIIRITISSILLFSAVNSQAALVTAPGDITNPTVIDFSTQPTVSGVPGPIQIGAAVTMDVTVDGIPNDSFFTNYDGWGLCDNGTWGSPLTYIASNNGPGTLRVAFNDGPMAAVGGFMNYALSCGSTTMLINAYDASMNLLETYDITADAVTPGGFNAGVFRGISRASADIAYFEIVGAFPVLDDLTFTADAPDADLSISKTDNVDPVTAGTELTYTIHVDNTGDGPADDVVVTDTLPPGVTLVSTSGCAEDPAGVPDCTLGTIASGGFAEYTVTVMVDSSTTGLITNNVSVTTSSTESSTDNNSATQDTTVAAEADLSITKMDSSDPFVSGSDQVLVYTIDVSNAGPSDATNVLVTDILPSVAIFQSTSGCQNDPVGVPVCQLGTIAAGASASYTVSVMLQRSGGTISNSASVTSDASDPTGGNNSAVETTDVTAIAIPTLNNLGLLMLMLLLTGFAWVSIRRS
ncbi:MAG: DUF11 domain-containing protein [Lysobacterales bacterium]